MTLLLFAPNERERMSCFLRQIYDVFGLVVRLSPSSRSEAQNNPADEAVSCPFPTRLHGSRANACSPASAMGQAVSVSASPCEIGLSENN